MSNIELTITKNSEDFGKIIIGKNNSITKSENITFLPDNLYSFNDSGLPIKVNTMDGSQMISLIEEYLPPEYKIDGIIELQAEDPAFERKHPRGRKGKFKKKYKSEEIVPGVAYQKVEHKRPYTSEEIQEIHKQVGRQEWLDAVVEAAPTAVLAALAVSAAYVLHGRIQVNNPFGYYKPLSNDFNNFQKVLPKIKDSIAKIPEALRKNFSGVAFKRVEHGVGIKAEEGLGRIISIPAIGKQEVMRKNIQVAVNYGGKKKHWGTSSICLVAEDDVWRSMSNEEVRHQVEDMIHNSMARHLVNYQMARLPSSFEPMLERKILEFIRNTNPTRTKAKISDDELIKIYRSSKWDKKMLKIPNFVIQHPEMLDGKAIDLTPKKFKSDLKETFYSLFEAKYSNKAVNLKKEDILEFYKWTGKPDPQKSVIQTTIGKFYEDIFPEFYTALNKEFKSLSDLTFKEKGLVDKYLLSLRYPTIGKIHSFTPKRPRTANYYTNLARKELNKRRKAKIYGLNPLTMIKKPKIINVNTSLVDKYINKLKLSKDVSSFDKDVDFEKKHPRERTGKFKKKKKEIEKQVKKTREEVRLRVLSKMMESDWKKKNVYFKIKEMSTMENYLNPMEPRIKGEIKRRILKKGMKFKNKKEEHIYKQKEFDRILLERTAKKFKLSEEDADKLLLRQSNGYKFDYRVKTENVTSFFMGSLMAAGVGITVGGSVLAFLIFQNMTRFHADPTLGEVTVKGLSALKYNIKKTLLNHNQEKIGAGFYNLERKMKELSVLTSKGGDEDFYKIKQLINEMRGINKSVYNSIHSMGKQILGIEGLGLKAAKKQLSPALLEDYNKMKKVTLTSYSDHLKEGMKEINKWGKVLDSLHLAGKEKSTLKTFIEELTRMAKSGDLLDLSNTTEISKKFKRKPFQFSENYSFKDWKEEQHPRGQKGKFVKKYKGAISGIKGRLLYDRFNMTENLIIKHYLKQKGDKRKWREKQIEFRQKSREMFMKKYTVSEEEAHTFLSIYSKKYSDDYRNVHISLPIAAIPVLAAIFLLGSMLYYTYPLMSKMAPVLHRPTPITPITPPAGSIPETSRESFLKGLLVGEFLKKQQKKKAFQSGKLFHDYQFNMNVPSVSGVHIPRPLKSFSIHYKKKKKKYKRKFKDPVRSIKLDPTKNLSGTVASLMGKKSKRKPGYIKNRKGKYIPKRLPPDYLMAKCIKENPGRFDGSSLSKDINGYYMRTHRARSKSYPHPMKIPLKDIKFIASTS